MEFGKGRYFGVIVPLVSTNASFVTEIAEQFKAFSNYIVADAYFSKRPFVEAVKSTTLEFISRLRDDSVLKYKYTGDRTGKRELQRNLRAWWTFTILIPINSH